MKQAERNGAGVIKRKVGEERWGAGKNQGRSGGRGGEVWGVFQQGTLRQYDMAHAINSGSVERPCLAICSGSGAFEGVGVTSTTTTPTTPSRHTHTQNPPSPPSSPGRHPARPAYISIKQLHGNLLPCRVGGVKRGVERRRGSLNNGLSDEKALGELDIHYKRATPRQAPGAASATCG